MQERDNLLNFCSKKDNPDVLFGEEIFIVPKKLSEIKKTQPLQLNLFEMLTETDVLTDDGNKQFLKNGKYSQTIELYDFMPRFVWGHQEDKRKDYNGLLPGLVREFECRGVPFRLTLTPATLVGKDGKSYASYPGGDEDILEIILRKLYLESSPQFFDGKPGMTFTINQIRRELKKQGKSRSHYEVIDSLLILRRSGISCQNKITKRVTEFNPIDVLSFSEKSSSGDEDCYLIFSDIVAKALENLYFRRFNYQQVIAYKSNIARLLHRRISHHFTQANEEVEYTINFSTLLRDFGLEYPTLSKAYISFKKAIDEMIASNVIKECKAEAIISASDSRKIEDYFLKIIPTKKFSFEMSNANEVTKNIGKIYNSLQDKTAKNSVKKSKREKLNNLFPISDS